MNVCYIHRFGCGTDEIFPVSYSVSTFITRLIASWHIRKNTIFNMLAISLVVSPNE
jgi:hypothetical protein